MQDGQNLFNSHEAAYGNTWQVVESLLGRIHTSQPLPVVAGVFNSGLTRAAEYSVQDILETKPREKYRFIGDQLTKPLLGNLYQATLAEEILPAIAAFTEIRTDRAAIAVAGSSSGGLASLYSLIKHPELFGTAISLSTHWSMSSKKTARRIAAALPTPEAGHRLWLDHGSLGLDAKYASRQIVVDEVLAERGWRWPQVESRVYIGTDHNESAWAARLPEILQWWLDGIPAA